jgi:hypothetical protein
MEITSSNIPLNRIQLLKLKKKAMRAGVWFRALPRIDRAIVDLTIKVAENVRSSNLAKSLFAVVDRLEGLLEGSKLRSLRLIGRPLAEKMSLIGQKLGNDSAKIWASDSSFALFLAVVHSYK